MPTSNRILFLLDAIILVSEVIRIFMRGRRGVMHDAGRLLAFPSPWVYVDARSRKSLPHARWKSIKYLIDGLFNNLFFILVVTWLYWVLRRYAVLTVYKWWDWRIVCGVLLFSTAGNEYFKHRWNFKLDLSSCVYSVYLFNCSVNISIIQHNK